MLFHFSINIYTLHIHLTVFNMAKKISIVAVHQVGEINYLIRLLIAIGMKMS